MKYDGKPTLDSQVEHESLVDDKPRVISLNLSFSNTRDELPTCS